ncbi:MAG TPA: hypothetical protein VFV87_11265, partial [Pirellulaceae bacterium]|nr:hypothetical protein [Pirellulaceae bacterium]
MSIHSKREEPADPNAIRPLSPTIRILVIVGELLLASLFLPLVALFPGVLVEREPGPFVVIGVGCLVAAYGLGLQRRWMVPASVAMVAISGYTLLRALDAISKSAGWGVVLLTIVPL